MRHDHTDEKGGPWTHGQLPDVEDYPFQTLDVPMDNRYSDTWMWLMWARLCAAVWVAFELQGSPGMYQLSAGEFKWPGKTPLGSSVADLVRKDSTGALATQDSGWASAPEAWHTGDSPDRGPASDHSTGRKERSVQLQNEHIGFTVTLDEFRARR